ncbi:MAG: hypothetical protein GY898_05140 [Proteobacteria bacterium]|nr:hypothetical protein [Pseudomonadota bacterium]
MTRNFSSFASTALLLVVATACGTVLGPDAGWRELNGSVSIDLDLTEIDPEGESSYGLGYDEAGSIGTSIRDDGTVHIGGQTFWGTMVTFDLEGGIPGDDGVSASREVYFTYATDALEFTLEGTDECTIELEDRNALSGRFDCDNVLVTSRSNLLVPKTVSFGSSWSGSIQTVAYDE